MAKMLTNTATNSQEHLIYDILQTNLSHHLAPLAAAL